MDEYKEEKLELFPLPDFFREPKAAAYAKVLELRAKYLREHDPKAVVEAAFDLVLAEYTASGNALTETAIDDRIVDSAVTMAIRICFYNVISGPFWTAVIPSDSPKIQKFDHIRYQFEFALETKVTRLKSLEREKPPVSIPAPTPPQKSNSKKRTTQAEGREQDRPSRYEDGSETPKGLLDRLRKQLHLKWEELQQLVEKEWIRRETQRRKDLGLEPAANLGFSLASLLKIRRGHTMEQPRREAIAAVLSSAKVRIDCEALRWRD